MVRLATVSVEDLAGSQQEKELTAFSGKMRNLVVDMETWHYMVHFKDRQ
jgi:hypothetical protein